MATNDQTDQLDLFSQTGEPQVQKAKQDKYAPVFRVQLVKERKLDLPTVTSPEDVAPVASKYLEGVDREHLIVILLSACGQIIGINTAHIGSLKRSVVSPREVFKPAILANADRIIVAHNHPSGSLEPSRADIQMTKNLKAAGELLDIPLIDSLVLGFDGKYASLAKRGVLD